MAGICQTEFDKWTEEVDEWRELDDEVDELLESALQADGAVLFTCGAAFVFPSGILGKVVLGGSCGIALWKLADAIDDLTDGIDKQNKLADKTNAQANRYQQCVADHKKDP